jgi:hypothetical protein
MELNMKEILRLTASDVCHNAVTPEQAIIENLGKPPRFQVGKPGDLNSDDPWFFDERDAINHAARLHETSSPFGKEPVGIWDDRSQ